MASHHNACDVKRSHELEQARTAEACRFGAHIKNLEQARSAEAARYEAQIKDINDKANRPISNQHITYNFITINGGIQIVNHYELESRKFLRSYLPVIERLKGCPEKVIQEALFAEASASPREEDRQLIKAIFDPENAADLPDGVSDADADKIQDTLDALADAVEAEIRKAAAQGVETEQRQPIAV